jgi:hypothetical protein
MLRDVEKIMSLILLALIELGSRKQSCWNNIQHDQLFICFFTSSFVGKMVSWLIDRFI